MTQLMSCHNHDLLSRSVRDDGEDGVHGEWEVDVAGAGVRVGGRLGRGCEERVSVIVTIIISFQGEVFLQNLVRRTGILLKSC